MIWDQEKIKSVLPHREPFLFLDEVLEIEGTERIIAVRRINKSEKYLNGHFPENPIMPGVLILEAMAQASVILFALDRPHIAERQPDYYLGSVKSDFLSPVFPEDQLILEANKVKFIDNAAITDTVARVHDKLVAKAKLVFSIQIK